MPAMLARLRRTGIDRGLLGGSRLWMAVGVLAWSFKAFTWMTRREASVVYQGPLKPGDRLLITASEPRQGHRGRKARRRRHH